MSSSHEANLASDTRDVNALCRRVGGGISLNLFSNDKGNVKYVVGVVVFIAFLYFLKCSNDLSTSDVMWWGLVLICLGCLLFYGYEKLGFKNTLL